MTTYTMVPPSGIQILYARTGNSYIPNSSGLIVNVAGTDVSDMLTNGCVLVGQTGLASQSGGYFGSGSANFLSEGNVSKMISSTGVSPGATGADNVLAVYTLPASSFDIAGRGICITSQGSFAATVNSKRVKIIFNPASATVGSTVGAGGTTVADTGTVTTSGTGWSVQANVFKYGAPGSNTQIGLHAQAQIGNAVASLLAPSLITATESGPIFIAITGNATTATTDIVFNFLEVNATN